MNKINMRGNNALLKKFEVKASQFEQTDSPEPYTAIHEVCFAGPETELKPGERVILKPDQYEHLQVEGVNYLFATGEQIAGTIERGAK